MLSGKVSDQKNYTKLTEILEAVASGDVKIGLVDASMALGYEHTMEEMSLRIYKILKYRTGYGVVLSGEAKRLFADIQSFVTANQNYITSFVEQKVGFLQPTHIEVEEVLFLPEEANSTLLNLCIILAGMLFIGYFFWLACIRKKSKITPEG